MAFALAHHSLRRCIYYVHVIVMASDSDLAAVWRVSDVVYLGKKLDEPRKDT